MVNFQELTAKLYERGWTDERLARKVGVSRAAIYALRIGQNREPRYNVGRELVVLEQRTRRRKDIANG